MVNMDGKFFMPACYRITGSKISIPTVDIPHVMTYTDEIEKCRFLSAMYSCLEPKTCGLA